MIVVALALALVVQQDTVLLKPVVVTATRVPVAADLVPSAITVLRAADLEARGIRTVAEALRAVPGVSVVETGSFGGQTSLFVRGGESDYTKVLVDGVPLNQAGGGIDLAHLTTDNVDRIEIARGPGSVLYGSDAVTGVVQIFTRGARGEGLGTARAGADFRIGSYGLLQGGVDVAGENRRVAYSARFARLSADGLFPYNNDYRNSVASARLTVTLDPRSEATLSYRYGDDLYHFPTNSQGVPADSNQRNAERGPLFSVGFSRTVGEQLDVRVVGTLREARLFFNDEADSTGDDAFWSRDYLRRAGGSAMISWRPRPAVMLTGGLEYEDQRQHGRNEFSGPFGTFPDSLDVQRWNRAVFTQAILGAGTPVAVTLGARLDDNSKFDTHATYRAGLVHRLRPDTRVRISAGTGFKEPTFFENFARGFVTGNPDLKPERSRSWEVGLERTVWRRATLALTYFSQRFLDLIDFDGSVAPGQPNYTNVPGATARGIETDLTASLAPAVTFTLRYTYLHTRVDKAGADTTEDALFVPGKPLLRRPAHTLAPEISASLGTRAHVSLGMRWVGKRDDRDFGRPAGQRRVTLDPYTRVNVAADYEIGRFVVSGRVENLFNDPGQETVGFRSRGRTLSVGARITVGR